jgi:hypothetical protein
LDQVWAEATGMVKKVKSKKMLIVFKIFPLL